MGTMSSNQKMFVGFAVGVVLGGGGMWLALDRGDGEALTVTGGGEKAATETALGSVPAAPAGVPADGEAGITVADQPAGMAVSVTNVMLPQAGWVVVHEDLNGAPGWVLGARRLPAGLTVLSDVELLRGTVAGGTYYAMLHADNGDGTFALGDDQPLLGEDGKFIMGMFKAQ